MKDASSFEPSTYRYLHLYPSFGAVPFLLFITGGIFMFAPLALFSFRAISSGDQYLLREGVLGLASAIIILFSVIMGYRWFSPVDRGSRTTGLRSTLTMGAITYALGFLWESMYIMPYYVPYFPMRVCPERILLVASPALGVLAGFLLLRLFGRLAQSPQMRDDVAKLASTAIGVLCTSALLRTLSSFPRIIEKRLFNSLTIATSNVIAYLSLGALTIDLYRRKGIRAERASAVIYIWLCASLVNYLTGLHRRGALSFFTLRRFFRSISLFSSIGFPSPGLVALLLVWAGIVLYRTERVSQKNLKTLYILAIVMWAVTNLISLIYVPATFGNFLRITGGLIYESGSPETISYLGGNVVGRHFIGIIQGIIILIVAAQASEVVGK